MAPKPPSPPTGTIPVAVSPRGGPQPARKSAATSVVERAVRRVVAPKPQPAPLALNPSPIDQIIAGYNAAAVDPAFGQTSISSGAAPTPASWKPTIGELQTFLMQDFATNQYAGGDGITVRPKPGSGANDAAYNLAFQSPGGMGLAVPLALAKSPQELADQLGMPMEKLAPLLEQTSKTRAEIAKQNETAKAQVDQQLAPPSHGGMTPDSLDRQPPVDPFSMVMPQQMSSDELTALIQSLDPKGSDQAAQRLEAAKRQIMADTGAYIDRQNQIAEVYRAGMAAGSMPAIPGAKESTAQSTYATAGSAKAAAAMPPDSLVNTSLDTTGTEERILLAAQAIEQQRQAEKRQELIGVLEAKAKEQKAAEDQVVAAAESAQKAADKAARDQQKKDFEAQTRVLYARELKGELAGQSVDVADQNSPNGAKQTVSGDRAYELVRPLVAAGARRTDILKQVFGLDVDQGDTPTAEQLRVIQAAEFAVGGNPTPLKADWQSYLSARMAAHGVA